MFCHRLLFSPFFPARLRVPFLSRSRPIALGLGTLLLLICTHLVPFSWFDARGQVALEAARVVLGLTLLLSWLGWAFSPFLLPHQWKHYEIALTPLLGVALFMPAAYLLNYLVDMRTASALMVVLSSPFGLRRFLRRRPLPPPFEGGWVPAACALGLLVAAFIPHVVQGSLGLLAYNGDEEGYFDLASYFLVYPAGSGSPGPAGPVFGHLAVDYRAEGWGYYYLMAAATAVSGVAPFSTYLAASYFLLSLSVLAWYLFFRETLGLPRGWAQVAVALYAVNGLPLWFAAFGFGRQISWLTFTPIVLSSFALIVRNAGIRAVVFAGLITGAFVMTETRLAVTHLATVLAGLALYWLMVDRRPSWVVRLSLAGTMALLVAAPALWYFVQAYLVQGSASTMFSRQSSDVVLGGPNMTRFFPFQEVLGLDATDLSKMREPIQQFSSLEWLDSGMSAVAPYLAYLLLLMALIGILAALVSDPLAVALVGGYFAWVGFTALVLRFPYGYFKLSAAGCPLLFGFVAFAAAWFSWTKPRIQFGALAWRRWVLVLVLSLFVVLMVRNSAYSILFGARGWGLSIPPDVVRGMFSLGQSTEVGSRVYISGFAEYPMPDHLYRLRKEHRLAMQSPEETRIVWAKRVRAMITSGLIGREVYGVFSTRVWDWSQVLPDDGYDYYILESGEDPRARGLDPGDVVMVADKVILYRSPGRARASAEQILVGRGSLRVDGKTPLVFSAGVGEVALTKEKDGGLRAGSGRVRIAILALAETTVELSAGSLRRSLAVDPGLSWYTTPDIHLPATVTLTVSGAEPIRVVALRALSTGSEELDRSDEAILSSEVTATSEAVDLELWYSNPVRDAKGASASIDVRGPKSVEQDLAMAVPDRGERWLLRFPLRGGGPQQFRNGVEEVPMRPVPWLENGGGQLLFRFNLGRERPKEYPLANAVLENGVLVRLERYLDPVQLRLWGYYHRDERIVCPSLESLENTIVRSEGGLSYLVSSGRRHWLPSISPETGSVDARTLAPDEVWCIPPGLPDLVGRQ